MKMLVIKARCRFTSRRLIAATAMGTEMLTHPLRKWM